MLYQRSSSLFKEAEKVIPGGVNSPVRAFGAVGGTPIFAKSAKGAYVHDEDGNTYIDYINSWGPMILGHAFEPVVDAVIEKAKQGTSFGMPTAIETEIAQLAISMVPNIDKIRFVNSGTEAIEGALKLARRATGRSQIISAHYAYHGNTMGSMSVMGYEERKQAFRPLIPDVDFITFNNKEDLNQITPKTAAVILETIQGGAGFIEPHDNYLNKVRTRCDEVGALLILDEIQPGIGRTGKLFGFEHYNCIPDILVTGKGLGGGMPIGAFTSSKAMMSTLQESPKLGHITTFGGHPVIAAAALATVTEITESNLMAEALEKEQLFRKHLVHPLISEIRGRGLMLAAITPSAEIANRLILTAQNRGLILFWLLFEQNAIRITPPLTITNAEIIEGCELIIGILEEISL